MAISFYKAHSDIEHLDLLEVARRKMKYSPNGGEEWWFTMVCFRKKKAPPKKIQDIGEFSTSHLSMVFQD